MSLRVTRILSATLCLIGFSVIAAAQSKLTAKASKFQPASSETPSGDNDRARDGLAGPVRRVRTEVVKLSSVSGKTEEEAKRVLLETSEYDVKGAKTQNQYFPISGATLTGREVYKYDDRGNISEMTLLNPDGSLISKEVYKYDFDAMGNWVKMTTAVAVVENGKITFEPTEVTYRTIFYYLDASMTKMLQPPASSSPAPVVSSSDTSKSAGATGKSEQRTMASLPPPSSADKLKGSSLQPVSLDLRSLPEANKKDTLAIDSEPAPAPRPLLKPVSGGVLNGKAVSLPPPSYPEVARRMRTSGTVEVEVVVDESGKVISAKAVSGPGVLRDVAVEAAMRARFSPTKLSGLPVKISGRINYNFTLP